MGIHSQTTSGFIDSLGAFIEGLADLGLTRGTDLFAENVLSVDRIPDKDALILFDEGYEQNLASRPVRMNWNVRLVTSRKTRPSALEALRPVVNEIAQQTRFIATDGTNSFRVLKVRVILSPEVLEHLDNGRVLGQASLQFDVIPM